MAARWIGLSRPSKKKFRRTGKRRDTAREFMHALGAASMLLMAAAMNFALQPEALAEVLSGEREILGFVPNEPSAGVNLPAPVVVVDEDEVRLLAATAWGEARSEGEDGMRAVAHVMVNRIGDRFGGDLETVIRAPAQFSAWNIGDPNRPLVQNPERYATGGVNLETWLAAQRIAREVLSGQSVDPTDGALFYHTTAIRPWWSRYGEGARTIGAHIFYSDVPNRRTRVTAVSNRRVMPIENEAAPEAALPSESSASGAASPPLDSAPATPATP